jgi:hypothetical protein
MPNTYGAFLAGIRERDRVESGEMGRSRKDSYHGAMPSTTP